MRMLGFEDRCDIASTRRFVRCTLLSVRSCFRASVHRASAIGAPARFMTASVPSRLSSQTPGSWPFQLTVVTKVPNSCEAARPFLVRTVTRWPLRDKDTHKACPMNPVPPVTTRFILSFYSVKRIVTVTAGEYSSSTSADCLRVSGFVAETGSEMQEVGSTRPRPVERVPDTVLFSKSIGVCCQSGKK